MFYKSLFSHARAWFTLTQLAIIKGRTHTLNYLHTNNVLDQSVNEKRTHRVWRTFPTHPRDWEKSAKCTWALWWTLYPFFTHFIRLLFLRGLPRPVEPPSNSGWELELGQRCLGKVLQQDQNIFMQENQFFVAPIMSLIYHTCTYKQSSTITSQ